MQNGNFTEKNMRNICKASVSSLFVISFLVFCSEPNETVPKMGIKAKIQKDVNSEITTEVTISFQNLTNVPIVLESETPTSYLVAHQEKMEISYMGNWHLENTKPINIPAKTTHRSRVDLAQFSNGIDLSAGKLPPGPYHVSLTFTIDGESMMIENENILIQ